MDLASAEPRSTITIAGEALIDIIADGSGSLTAVSGGGPFNVASNLGRLGVPCTFLGSLSDDPFGVRLRAELLAAGVALARPEPIAAPTTLAVAELDASGAADYRFYVSGTSAASLEPSDVPSELLASSRFLVLGGLGLLFEPIRSTVLAAVRSTPDVAVVLDPNCRPRAIDAVQQYRSTIRELLGHADIVKVSHEDVMFLAPEQDPVQFGVEALTAGVAVVVITRGSGPVTVMIAKGMRHVGVPPMDVIDSIGAGDAFLAGLLAWLHAHPEVSPRHVDLDLLCEGVRAAVSVAATVCGVSGARLPHSTSLSSIAPVS